MRVGMWGRDVLERWELRGEGIPWETTVRSVIHDTLATLELGRVVVFRKPFVSSSIYL